MNKFFSFIENKTEMLLTKRKAKKLYLKQKNKTVLSEIWSWVDALLFAIFWVIIINQYLFQLFVIPSPSMVPTLLVGDRVIVNKDSYGIELYPAGKKILSKNRPVFRDDIITFYNPEYDSKGPIFDILSQVIYMGTLTLVNIDKNKDGTPAERLYVKRAVGLGGDEVKIEEGNVFIKLNGTDSFVSEALFRKNNNLSLGPNRSVDSSKYSGLNAAAIITAYQEKGKSEIVPQQVIRAYQKIQNTEYDYIFDFYEYQKVLSKKRKDFNPSDMNLRSEYSKYENGYYVPEGYVLPLGDNRDNSNDGRYFGPVKEEKVNGKVIGRFWPLNRIKNLSNQ